MTEEDLIVRLIPIVREADEEFEASGGGTKHWIRDHFLPLLEADRLRIVE